MAEGNKPVKTSAPGGIHSGRGKKQGEDLSSFFFGRVLPQAVPLEEVVLGAIMLDKDALSVVLDILRAESFYRDEHQQIFRAMLRLFERSNPVDALTVMEELRKMGELEAVGGPAYLANLTMKVASAANLEYHARIISQKFIQRELIRTSTKIVRDSFEDTTDVFELLDEAEQGLFSIAEQNMSRSFDTISSLAGKALKQIEELKNKKDGLTGIPTGFTELDRLTSGLQRSDLIILAARPGMGKTALVLSLARNTSAEFRKGVAIFSLEMSSLQLAQRLIAMEAEIPGSKMRNGQLEEYEWQQLHTAIERIGEAPVYIDDTPGINIFELRAKCRRLKMQYDIQLIIIDYLQLMSGGGDNQRGNREQEVSAISRSLKNLAKELNVPVIALSQLSRAVETRGGSKRPQLSDLRESGCLTGDTLLQNAETGERMTIQSLAERKEQVPIQVFAVDPNYKIKGHTMVKAFYSGKKEVFELTTRTGRKIKASANHPFLKLEGWTRLDNLEPGDSIGVFPLQERQFSARVIPDFESVYLSKYAFRDSEIVIHPQKNHSTFADFVECFEEKAYETQWDNIVSITPLGFQDVYDATVAGVHNFVANDIIVHNSIEQDADMVAFIYRPEYYQIMEDEEGQSLKGVAEVIVAKHRHGALKTIRLRFTDEFARFSDLDDPDFGNLPADTFDSYPSVITRPSKMNEEEDIPF